MWREGPERPGETEGDEGSETGGWRLGGGAETQRREDRDFAGARDSETGDQRLRERQRKVHFGDVVLGEPLRPSSCLRPPDYDERSHLHDAFTQMTHSLQEVAAAQGSFRVAFPHAAEKIQKIILQLKEVECCRPGPAYRWNAAGLAPPPRWTAAGLALSSWRNASGPETFPLGELQVGTCRDLQGSNACSLSAVRACIPPCGLQEVARRFRCRGCYSTVCDLPLDCPVQDLTVTRGHQAMFFCTVNFQLPKEEITYSWKFAGGGVSRGGPSVPQLRTQDLSYFREIPRARGYLARIRPVQPTHRGTFSCVITHDQRPLARLYFFLNGAGGAELRGRGGAT
ncbi:hypothetical protein J1605_021757 [Eschrichtius robustus]|uniref:Ig-like domain-containing protein n=1 Tax=Eschrichtius robustus TaxID=9764 RepID=A0AB34HGU2_ESCRO|nr:hypothetical protein J1605_021757 [Eschrichtius robustus]